MQNYIQKRIRSKQILRKNKRTIWSKTFGIIFDIPAYITEEELKENIISPIKILKTKRVSRTQEGMKFPTRRVKIVFDGLEVPKEVTFGYTKIKVKPFVAFAQCYHFAQHCKQLNSICAKCGISHDNNIKCSKEQCVNCKGNHEATNKDCPARIKAYTI